MHAFDLAPALHRPRLRRAGGHTSGLSCNANQPPRNPLDFPDFVPRNLTGTMLWLRADLGISLNGANVSAWADQSGTGDVNRNATQATAAKQPAFVASDATLNNRPSVSSSAGTNQCLVTGVWSVALPAVATIFLVGKVQSLRYACDALTLAPQFGVYSVAATFWSLIQQFSLSSSVSSAASAVLIGRYNGAASKINISSNTPDITGDVGTGSATGVTLLNSASSAGFPDGGATLAEIAYYNRVLSDAECAQLNGYAATRYGLVIA